MCVQSGICLKFSRGDDMPRPCKLRRICALPAYGRFVPADAGAGEAGDARAVEMTVDEFEAIRLIDLEGLRQEECAARMNVARTTAQAIYNSAREKLARCLVYGCELRIGGGEYILCDGAQECACSGCKRRCRDTGCCEEEDGQ